MPLECPLVGVKLPPVQVTGKAECDPQQALCRERGPRQFTDPSFCLDLRLADGDRNAGLGRLCQMLSSKARVLLTQDLVRAGAEQPREQPRKAPIAEWLARYARTSRR
jgi:hypothetical protein